MDKSQILNELNKNLNTFRGLDEKISIIMFAIYQKSIQEIKNKKIKELKTYFSNQVNYFEQSISNYQNEIDKIVKEYTKELDKLIKVYDYLYSNIFDSMEKAINNQTIAIGNIVKLFAKKNNDNMANINNISIAIIQKKVNYSVIVEECKARLKWCIENAEKDMNEIFQNNFYQLEIYKKNSFIENIRRKILNIISGKKKCAEVINKYTKENLKKIAEENSIKIIDIVTTTKGILKQIQNVEEQISTQYAQVVHN